HEGKRRDLNDARFDVTLDLLRRQHVVECIVERSQIGVDLFTHIAGQEAQALARLDSGPRQDDAIHGSALETLRGKRHCDIGLAGAWRTETENQIVFLDGADVSALHRRAGFDDAAPRDDLRLSVGDRSLGPGMAEKPIEVARSHRLTFRSAHIYLFQTLARNRTWASRACQNNDIAVRVRVNSESVFKEREVAVEFTEQLCQQTVVFEGYYDTSGFKYWLARPSRRWRGCPAKCSQIPTLLFWPYPKIESPLAPTLASKRLLGTFAVCLTHNFTCAHYNRFMLQL